MPARASAFAGFDDFVPRRTTPLRALLCILLVVALASLATAFGARWLVHAAAPMFHTESRQVREIVVGSSVLRVPENVIREPRMRRDGAQERLDLYFRWPQMEGYTPDARAAFNHTGGSRSIIYATIAPRRLAHDMSDRLEPIYRHLVAPEEREAADGLTIRPFREEAGFAGEVLVVGERPPERPFVARCLTGDTAAHSLAPCEREVHFGDDLSLVYRFPREILNEWLILDEKILAGAGEYLTARSTGS